jgi:hypothetical protein
MIPTSIINLAGETGSGKSETSQELVKRHGVVYAMN